MPCPSRRIRGPIRNRFSWNNWRGNAARQVERYFEPISLPEIVNIVIQAEAANKRLHVVGGAYSLNNCAAGEDWMIDLQHLNRLVGDTFTAPVGRAALIPLWHERLTGGLNTGSFTSNLAPACMTSAKNGLQWGASNKLRRQITDCSSAPWTTNCSNAQPTVANGNYLDMPMD